MFVLLVALLDNTLGLPGVADNTAGAQDQLHIMSAVLHSCSTTVSQQVGSPACADNIVIHNHKLHACNVTDGDPQKPSHSRLHGNMIAAFRQH